jgi:hypothetical protein
LQRFFSETLYWTPGIVKELFKVLIYLTQPAGTQAAASQGRYEANQLVKSDGSKIFSPELSLRFRHTRIDGDGRTQYNLPSMARRRVFQTKLECPGIHTDLSLTANRIAMVGRTVTFEKPPSTPEVTVCLDGAAVGHLDNVVGPQVASAIDRGQLFTAVINNAYQNYDKKFKPTAALIYLKVEYILEKGQPSIEIPRVPVEIHQPTSKSFFTKIAGVTHEGRQRVIARCSVGERLLLVRDPNNDFDTGAIKVMRLNGEQLGFIPAHVSRGDDPSGLALRMDRGDKYQCRISNLTGRGKEALGVNIEIAQGEFDGAEETEITTPSTGRGSYRLPPNGPHVNRENFLLGWAVLIFMIVALALAARGCGPNP